MRASDLGRLEWLLLFQVVLSLSPCDVHRPDFADERLEEAVADASGPEGDLRSVASLSVVALDCDLSLSGIAALEAIERLEINTCGHVDYGFLSE